MKSYNFVLGCLVAGICLFASCNDEEVPMTGISISPDITSMNVGEEVELTATLAPSGAKGDVVWVSGDPTTVSVTSTGGNKATLKALKPIFPGDPIEVFATESTGILISNILEVTVNLPSITTDYAALLVADGPFVGNGTVSLLDDAPIRMGLVFTRVSNNVLKVTGESFMGTMVTQSQAGTFSWVYPPYQGSLDQRIFITSETGNTCTFYGWATMPGGQPANGQDLPVVLSGTYNSQTKVLTMEVRSNLTQWQNDPLVIPLVAEPGVLAAPWVCRGSITGLAAQPIPLTGIAVSVLKNDDNTVGIAFALDLPGNPNAPVTGDLALSGNQLSGTLSLGGAFDLQTTGTVNFDNKTITLNITGNIGADIAIILTNVD